MYLLDTNTVIDFFNAKLPDNGKNLLLSVEPAISVITFIELFSSSKISESERLILLKFVNTAIVYETINSQIAMEAINIRQQYKTKLPDAIIAATALFYGLILITHNSDDFKNIQGLSVIDPFLL